MKSLIAGALSLLLCQPAWAHPSPEGQPEIRFSEETNCEAALEAFFGLVDSFLHDSAIQDTEGMSKHDITLLQSFAYELNYVSLHFAWHAGEYCARREGKAWPPN